MGDSGSYFFGYMIAALAIYGQNQHEFSIIAPMYGYAIFGYDVLLVMAKRLAKGQSITQRHFQFIHLRLKLGIKLSDARICQLLLALNALNVALLLGQSNPRYPEIVPLLLIGLIMHMIHRHLDQHTDVHRINMASP